jgi:pyridoxamine 5'-phosphate oxidase
MHYNRADDAPDRVRNRSPVSPQRPIQEMSDTGPIEHPTWLRSGDFTEADEPLRLFAAWFEDAKRAEPNNPDAMALATVDADGLPNVRMVLLKGFDERGFVFYSNEGSRKGHELAATPKAGLAFHWKSLRRQVRLRGTVASVGPEEADAYFASRPRSSQIGAWASKQSTPLESRHAFEKAIALNAAKFAIGAVPRPPFWIGYRVTPTVMEFWHDRPFRLHDRVEFRRADAGAPWTKVRLYP